MKKRKVKVRNEVRVNLYRIFSRAVEEGIEYGWNRARKYTDEPDEATVKEAIHDAITNEVSELFDFGDFYADR